MGVEKAGWGVLTGSVWLYNEVGVILERFMGLQINWNDTCYGHGSYPKLRDRFVLIGINRNSKGYIRMQADNV